MDAVVLHDLPVTLDVPAILGALHVRDGSPAEQSVRRLVQEAAGIARPKAIYRLGFIDERDADYVVIDGMRFASRILRVNLDHLQRAFLYVCTSGCEVEAWAEGQGDMLARYYADAINQAVLRSATNGMVAHLAAAYALAKTATMNPGSLTDWPISQQRPLFALLGDTKAAIGVELTPSYLMVPTKSVSGILYATEETFASCQLCPRDACPNRRAPYDAGLFARKYATS